MGDTYPVDYKKLKATGDSSALFSILKKVEFPNPNILNRQNSFRLIDNDFNFLIDRHTSADFSVVIVNRPLEGDFFSRRISDKLIAVSVFEIDALNIHEGIKVEMFLTRFIYGFVTIYLCFNNSLPTNGTVAELELIQMEAKGCLFDFCRYKPQVALFFRQPKISPEAITKLRTKPLPENFIEALNKEIQKLKIGRYYKIKDGLKENPVTAILMTFFVGLIFSELLGNYIYDLIHDCLPLINNATIPTE